MQRKRTSDMQQSLVAKETFVADKHRELMHAWKNADNAAKLADRLLTAKFDAYLARKGPMPSEGDRMEVQRLRRDAAEKLNAAIEYLAKR